MSTGFKITRASGASWVKQNDLLNSGWGTNTVQDGIYANGKYTVVGTGGHIADSVDGITWTDRPHLRLKTLWGTGTIYTISWSGSLYIIAGDSAYTATSPDGITWTFSSLLSTAWSTGNPAVDSLWTGSNFIVVGASNKFAISNNGVSFSSYYNGPGTPGVSEKRINWNGSQYLMTAGTTGLAYTSPDATTWTSRDVTGSNSAWLSESVIKVRYVNGIFVAGGTNGRIATSSDGVTWTYRPGIGTGGFGNSINEIVWDGSKYVFVTAGSDYVGSTTDFVTYAAAWSTLQPAFGSFFTSVLISNSGKYVISSVYGRTSYSGDNGVTWSAFTSASGSAGAFGASLYLLVRDSGAYLTSSDGTTWTARTGLSSTSWSTTNINDIVWNGSKFLVVGDSGKIATSTDGLTWTYQGGLASTSWGTSSVRCVTWTGSQFVVGGDSGKIATSSDGVTWTYQGGLISTSWGTTTVSSIAWSGTKYVVGGSAGSIAYSSDAATWTFLGGSFNLKDSYYGLTTINTIIWNSTSNTYLVAGNSGRVATGNTAGIIWSYQGGLANTAWGTTNVRDGLWDGSKYILVGDSGKVATSADGITWTNQTGLSSTTYSTNTSNKVLANGTNQYIVAGTSFNTANSSNAVTWTYQTGLTSTGWSTDTINKIIYNGTFWLAVGPAGKVATSYDKIFWTFQNGLRSTSWGTTDNVNDVIWNGTQFLVTGPNGKIATSPDGITWTYRSGLSSTTWSTSNVNGVAYGNGVYVVGGGGTGVTTITATSTDGGVTWTYSSAINSSFGARGLYVLAFGNGVFCAAGQYAACATSPDGITWTDRGTSFSTAIAGGTPGNLIWDAGGNQFLASQGYGAAVVTSPNGITWTAKTTLTQFASRQLFGILFYKNNYYAYGQEGRIVKSPDLITWTDVNGPGVSGSLIPTSFDIRTIAFNDSDDTNQLVIGGTSAVMYMGAFENYRADVDDVLVRRDNFSTGSLWYWDNTTMSPVTAAGSGLTWKFLNTLNGRSINGIKTDGTLWTWGTNQAVAPTQISFAGYTNNDWKSFACGYQYPGAQATFMGIKTDGTMWAWGGNGFGELGVGDSVGKGSPVTVVGGHTWKSVAMAQRSETIGNNLAIRTDDTLWYMNVSPVQETTFSKWKQIAVNESISGIKTDGTLWNWSGTASPTTIAGSGGYRWKSVSCGYRCTWAIREDGTLWGIGNNTYGQLGLPGYQYFTMTQLPGGGTNWKSVFNGMAIKTDGTLWAWGSTPGDGTSVAKASPVLVTGGITDWKTASVGSDNGGSRTVIRDITT